MSTPLTVSKDYEAFYERQAKIQQEIDNKANTIQERFTKFLNLSPENKRKKYDQVVGTVERLREELDQMKKNINDILPKINESAKTNIASLENIGKFLDDFMIDMNKAQIGTLEDLMRSQIKSMSKKKSLSPRTKTVVDKTYGGSKRRTKKRTKK